jgi:hypothetical protein
MPYGKLIDLLVQIEAAYKQVSVLETKLHAIEQTEKAPQIIVQSTSCAKDLCLDSFYATSTPNKMTITWKTNRPAASKIWWGSNDISTNMTPLTDISLSVSHTATFLSTFTASTTFHYIVSATDANGRAATSSLQTYITPTN